MTCPYDVPDGPLEPSDGPEPRMWCDRCRNWCKCPCGCGWGWCPYILESTRPDCSEECGGFDGVPPDPPDPPDGDR